MPLQHDYSRTRAIADRLLQKFGALAVLRRASGDRNCWTAVIDYKPIERLGKLLDPMDRRALVSAVDPDDGTDLLPPDSEQDRLIVTSPQEPFETQTWRILAPVGKYAVGPKVIVYDLQVRL